jgi:hypothetical protein
MPGSESGSTPAELLREVRANAWTIDDVRNVDADLPIAVVTLPPRRGSKTYDHAVDLFQGLEADVVQESELDEWAEEAARDVSPQLGLRGAASR